MSYRNQVLIGVASAKGDEARAWDAAGVGSAAAEAGAGTKARAERR